MSAYLSGCSWVKQNITSPKLLALIQLSSILQLDLLGSIPYSLHFNSLSFVCTGPTLP